MKTAVVTGGSDGVGKALVYELADKGFRVLTIGRSAGKLQAVKKYQPELIETVAGDLTKPEDLDNFTKKIKSEFKKIDLLVNNAGIQIGNNLLENAGIADLEKMFAIHVIAPLKLYQSLLPVLKTSANCRIINIVSTVVNNYLKETYGPYTISKYGEYGLGKMMIKEATKHRIKITNVILGGVETNIRNTPRPDYLKPDEAAATLMQVITAPDNVYIPEISIYPQIQML